MATADLTVLALGRPDASAGEYIAEIQRRLGAQERLDFLSVHPEYSERRDRFGQLRPPTEPRDRHVDGP